MALTVEDGTGVTGAESYASVSDATTYLTNFGVNTTWDSKTVTEQEVALRTATRFIDQEYGRRWKGTRTYLEQNLHWPRANIVDRDNTLVSSTTIPTEIINATIVLANSSLSETLKPDLANSGTIKRKKIRAGEALEQDITYVGGSSPYKHYTLVNDFVSQYINPRGMIDRG